MAKQNGSVNTKPYITWFYFFYIKSSDFIWNTELTTKIRLYSDNHSDMARNTNCIAVITPLSGDKDTCPCQNGSNSSCKTKSETSVRSPFHMHSRHEGQFSFLGYAPYAARLSVWQMKEICVSGRRFSCLSGRHPTGTTRNTGIQNQFPEAET